jgi:uncharacterized membrane protein
MKKSWRTTLFGLIASVASLIVTVPEVVDNNQKIVKVAAFVMAGGFAGMGIVSRDNNKSDEQAGAGKKP